MLVLASNDRSKKHFDSRKRAIVASSSARSNVRTAKSCLRRICELRLLRDNGYTTAHDSTAILSFFAHPFCQLDGILATKISLLHDTRSQLRPLFPRQP